MVICDPPTQSANQVAATVGATRDEVDYIADLLVPPGVLVQSPGPSPDDYLIRMEDSAWPKRMEIVFANIPNFHRIMVHGLEVLAGALPERRQRVANTERLFRYLKTEIPVALNSWDRDEVPGR